MDYKLVDTLTGYQLEPGDAIRTDGDILFIQSIEYLERGYKINYLDEYEDELISLILDEDQMVDLYMPIDD